VEAPGALSKIATPLLMVSADWDETVDPTHHRELAEQYDFISLVRIPGARHEIMMEKDEFRDQFWAAFDDYMSERLASDASANIPPGSSSAIPDRIKSNIISAN
ncbi:MAG: hypothetical protein AAGA69_07620, partial [Pseudomonadota bacterium]